MTSTLHPRHLRVRILLSGVPQSFRYVRSLGYRSGLHGTWHRSIGKPEQRARDRNARKPVGSALRHMTPRKALRRHLVNAFALLMLVMFARAALKPNKRHSPRPQPSAGPSPEST